MTLTEQLELIAHHFTPKMRTEEEYRIAVGTVILTMYGETYRTVDYFTAEYGDRPNPFYDYTGSYETRFPPLETSRCNGEIIKTTWWWKREQARILSGVYPAMTETLTNVIDAFSLQQFCLHPSSDKDTPEAVAYTPDRRFGEEDRQLKLATLGKFLSKYCPILTDDFIRKMEAQHRAELSMELSLSESPEDAARIYMDSAHASSCMRYSPDCWSLKAPLHPAMAYHHDTTTHQVRVAYISNTSGTVLARAVCWINKITGERGYVRSYGMTTMMDKRLKYHGYKLLPMSGVPVKALWVTDNNEHLPDGPIEDGYDAYRLVMPYIDGVGGNQSNSDGTFGYVDKDDLTSVQLVSSTSRNSLIKAGINPTQFKAHSSVVHTVRPSDLSSMKFTCPISGIEVDKARDAWMEVYTRDKVIAVAVTAYVRDRFPTSARPVSTSDKAYKLDPNEYKLFNSHNHWEYVIDTEHNRLLDGQVRRSAVVYGDTDWVYSKDYCLTNDHGWVAKDDLVQIIDADGTLFHRPVKFIVGRELSKAGYVLQPSKQGRIATYVHSDHPSMVVVNGKKLSTEYNELTKLWDGEYAFTRNTAPMAVLGRTFTMRKSEVNEYYTIDKDKLVKAWMEWAYFDDPGATADEKNREINRLMERIVQLRVNNLYPILLSGGDLSCSDYRPYGMDNAALITKLREQVGTHKDRLDAAGYNVQSATRYAFVLDVIGMCLNALDAARPVVAVPEPTMPVAETAPASNDAPIDLNQLLREVLAA